MATSTVLKNLSDDVMAVVQIAEATMAEALQMASEKKTLHESMDATSYTEAHMDAYVEKQQTTAIEAYSDAHWNEAEAD